MFTCKQSSCASQRASLQYYIHSGSQPLAAAADGEVMSTNTIHAAIPNRTPNKHLISHPQNPLLAMVLEAGYPSTTGFRKVVKATILVRKKPGLSDEAFIEHYNHKHAQMAAPVLQKHNVITYSLVGQIDPKVESRAQKLSVSQRVA